MQGDDVSTIPSAKIRLVKTFLDECNREGVCLCDGWRGRDGRRDPDIWNSGAWQPWLCDVLQCGRCIGYHLSRLIFEMFSPTQIAKP
jgi:hypothetical protein